MQSMTGFGRSVKSTPAGNAEFVFELKSVNQRGLDLKMRLPRASNELERRLSTRVRQRFTRGRFDVVLSVQSMTKAATDLQFDAATARVLVEEMRDFAKAQALADDLRVGDLLRRSELFHTREALEYDDDTLTLLTEAFDEALEDLEKSRNHEGEGLFADLAGRLDACLKWLKDITARTADAPLRQKQRLEARLREIEAAVSPERLAQEIALLAERADVSEEISRLHVHLDHFRQLMDSQQAVGRKLDFLCQELNREANTIGSKCSDAPTAHLVVELKSEIERVREQVQNVE